MNDLPIVLSVGIDNSRPEYVIEKIIDSDNIEKNDGYRWKIDTKYYTAETLFCVLNCKNCSLEKFSNHIEAVVLYVDHSVESLEKELNEWKSVIHEFHTDAKIVISKHSLGVDQQSAVETWCRENEYEFIELECADSHFTPDIEELCGIQRVVEVLQNHQWSNLQLKKQNTPSTPASNVVEKIPEISSNTGLNVENPDDMDQLFGMLQNLRSMKLNISSMTEAEKLDQAETVVKTFWRAIGGDMNEFSDSDNEIV